MFVYQVVNGKAIPMNDGPQLEGTFKSAYVHWDGTSTPKERKGPPRGFRKSDHKSTKVEAQAPVEVNLVQLKDFAINPDLFIPMQTGTILDKLVSNDGGFLPGTNVMAVGQPGIGKTTVLLETLSLLQQQGKRVLFISAEMNRMDVSRYLNRFPNWAQVPILFLGEYESQSDKVIEQTLSQGWDIVLTDSYTEVGDHVKENTGWSRGKTEKWFLQLMEANNRGENTQTKYTCFVTILQVNKGGQFAGSNKLKHLATSMLHMDWEGSENGRRYIEFSKNRVGDVNKKLYFSFDEGLQFNEARFQTDIENDALLKEEQKQLETEGDAFDRIFGFSQPTESEESVEA
jgi:DNA repair protein RadA/Sms